MGFFLEKLKLRRRGIALLAQVHFFGNPSKKLKIVGVTGTNGKTTIATLLYKVSMGVGHKAGLISTVENLINEEKVKIDTNKVKAPGTTPDPIYLHKLLNEMAQKGCEYVFIEVSSHALDQGRVAGINFAGGIFTNLTQDHLDYHKNFRNYFEAKKKFFKMLPASAFALSNADDEYGKKMLEGIRARKFLYEFSNVGGPATLDDRFVGEIVGHSSLGLELKIGDELIKSKLLGKFNAYNLLAVWSACSLLGFDMLKVSKTLQDVTPPRGRFEHLTLPNGALAIVDYAHTPDALDKILTAVKEIKPENGRIISVFGCAGDRDPQKRPMMGHTGATHSDVAIFTSDNPRSEDPEKIISEMQAGLSVEQAKKVMTISNRREAIKKGVSLAQKGDILLVAGKGHEDYQEIKGVYNHFDDIEELKKGYE